MAFYKGATPAELTAFARTQAENEAHLNEESLARLMPNENVEVPFVSGTLEAAKGSGLAGFRGWDAEAGIGKRSKSAKKFSVDLAPVTEKGVVSERERMTAVNGDLEARTKELVEDLATDNVISVLNFVELCRAKGIFRGKVEIKQEDGFIDEIDYKRPAEAYKALDTLWTTSADGILTDLEKMVEEYEALTGGATPGAGLMSRRIFNQIKRSKDLRVSLGMPANSKLRIDDSHVRAILEDIGIPDVILYDHTYGPVGARQRFTPVDELALVPTPVGINDGAASGVARTFWTRSAESMKPNYALAPEAQFGVVAGAFENEDNAQIWTKADACVAPMIVHPEYFMVRKVL